MSPIDFDKLRGDVPAGDEPPEDGDHVARLERAVVVDTKRGEQVITEWSNEANVMWTSWNRFDATGLPYTQELLDGLGIDRSKVTEETLSDELARCEGATYQVTTSATKGSQGDRWFINTYVNQAVSASQRVASDAPDVPADANGLPEPDAGAAMASKDLFGDDDIPF